MSPSRGSTLRVSDAVPVFAALGDPTRLSLVGRLAVEGPLSITRLSEGSGITRQAVTRHLVSLGDAGVVRNSRSGRERVWELNLRRLEEAKGYLDEISSQWDAAANRLKVFVEENP